MCAHHAMPGAWWRRLGAHRGHRPRRARAAAPLLSPGHRSPSTACASATASTSSTTPRNRAPAAVARTARYAWALLLARIDEVCPLACPQHGGEIRIIAFITDAATVRAILTHLGEPTAPPRSASARGPPLWAAADAEHDPTPDPPLAPAPAYEFDSASPGNHHRRRSSVRAADYGPLIGMPAIAATAGPSGSAAAGCLRLLRACSSWCGRSRADQASKAAPESRYNCASAESPRRSVLTPDATWKVMIPSTSSCASV